MSGCVRSCCCCHMQVCQGGATGAVPVYKQAVLIKHALAFSKFSPVGKLLLLGHRVSQLMQMGTSVTALAMLLQPSQKVMAAHCVCAAVFPTSTKDTDVIGADALAEICAAVSIPVVAIGGITAGNAATAIEAGCAGVAVVSAIFAQPDVSAAAAEIRAAVDAALAAHSSRRK